MFDPTDLPSRDTEMAPTLYRCDARDCTAHETTEAEFFCCPECSDSLCPDHADGAQKCHGQIVCLNCFEKDRDAAYEAYYSNR